MLVYNKYKLNKEYKNMKSKGNKFLYESCIISKRKGILCYFYINFSSSFLFYELGFAFGITCTV